MKQVLSEDVTQTLMVKVSLQTFKVHSVDQSELILGLKMLRARKHLAKMSLINNSYQVH